MADDEAQQLIRLLREVLPVQIATELVEVQPMSGAFFEGWNTAAWKTEEELIAEGYEPVCQYTRLMWTKKRNYEE